MKNFLKIIIFVFMVAVLVWGTTILFQKNEKNETEVIKSEEGKGGTSESRESAIPIKVLKVKRASLPMRLPISATADAWEKATIKSEVDGVVDNINVQIGQRVSKDDIIVKVDDSEIQLNMDKAVARRLQSYSKYITNESTKLQETGAITPETVAEVKGLEVKFNEAQAQYDKGKIPESEYKKIRNDYQEKLIYSGLIRDDIRRAHEGLAEADIALKEADLQLKRTKIRSPFPASISDILISRGAKISRGQDVVKLVNLQSVYLKGYALESEVQNLRKGMLVRVKFDSFKDEVFYGKIASISPEIEEQNKTIKIYVDVDNKDAKILPGMHAAIDVEYKIHNEVIKVPRVAVLHRNDRPLVFKVDLEKEMALWQYVELGDKNDEDQILLSGIEDGDLIVVDGHITLAHQSKVKILETAEQQ